MFIKKLFSIIVIALFCSAVIYAQEVLRITPSDATNPETFLNAQITADSSESGGIKENRVYELDRDAIYIHNRQMTVDAGETLRIRAAAGDGRKPVVYLYDAGTGSGRPPGNMIVLNGGDLELKDICIAGFYEPDPAGVDGVQGGLINTTGAGANLNIDGVLFSNVNGQHIRTGFDVGTISIRNTIFANMGALTTSNLGAGKGLDFREAEIDTFILENCTFVNYQDRPIRHYNFNNPSPDTGGTRTLHYAKINHNTFINGMGYHGLFSLGNVGEEIVITNNLFVDGFALGEDPSDTTRTKEWANTQEYYEDGTSRITWIFTAQNDVTNWVVSNNYFAISDSGQAFLNDYGFGPASPLSWHINSRLGADSADAFTQIDLELVNTPALMTNMMRWYETPDAEGGAGKSKLVNNFNKELHDYDRRYIQYYRDTLDASYPSTSPAFTASTGGLPVGDLNWFEGVVSVPGSNLPSGFALGQNYPNPFNPSTKISFNLDRSAHTVLSVYNLLGQKVATLISGEMPSGYHEINFDASKLSTGVYFYQLESGSNISTKKMLLMK
ncbi:MAG: T9SS type A sorting domain-containing protein [Ignavibacteriaceae bacterium]